MPDIKIISGKFVTRKVEFQKLINHNSYSLPFVMETYKWLVATSSIYYDSERWGTRWVLQWLHGKNYLCSRPAYSSEGFDNSIDTENFLKLAFVRTIADTNCPDCVKRWRKAERVELGKYRMLKMPVNSSSAIWQPYIYSLYDFIGTELKESLNDVRYAPHILDIKIYVSLYIKPHWVLRISTGQDDDKRNKVNGKTYSSWDFDILRCESYTDLVFYGVHKLHKMTGANEELKTKRWWGKGVRHEK